MSPKSRRRSPPKQQQHLQQQQHRHTRSQPGPVIGNQIHQSNSGSQFFEFIDPASPDNSSALHPEASPVSAEIHSTTGKDVILRAEIPDLGLRKAIRVQKDATVNEIIAHILRKSNLEAVHFRNYRLRRPLQPPPIPSAKNGGAIPAAILPSGNAEWLDGQAALESQGRWKDHDVIQLALHPKLADNASVKSMPIGISRRFSVGRLINKHGQKHPQQQSSPTLENCSIAAGNSFSPPSDPHATNNNTKKIIKKWGNIASNLSSNMRQARSKGTSPAGEKTFGVPLHHVACAENGVPIVIEKSLEYLESNDMKSEGLFRLSGAASIVQALKDAFDQSSKDGVEMLASRRLDGHAIAGIVKLFLRELPEPLLTFELYDAWLAAHDVASPELRLHVIYQLVRALPQPNYRLLSRLCTFFHRLAQFGEINKMTWQNLATVLGPNILRSQHESVMTMVNHAGAVNAIALELIRGAPDLFADDFYQRHPELDRVRYESIVKAQYPYNAQLEEVHGTVPELSFDAGDCLFVLSTSEFEQCEQSVGWWVAEMIGKQQTQRKVGIIPSNYVEVLRKFSSAHDVLVKPDPVHDISKNTPMESTSIISEQLRQEEMQESLSVPIESFGATRKGNRNFKIFKEPSEIRESVEDQNKALKEENTSLKGTIVKLMAENKLLKTRVEFLETSIESLEVALEATKGTNSAVRSPHSCESVDSPSVDTLSLPPPSPPSSAASFLDPEPRIFARQSPLSADSCTTSDPSPFSAKAALKKSPSARRPPPPPPQNGRPASMILSSVWSSTEEFSPDSYRRRSSLHFSPSVETIAEIAEDEPSKFKSTLEKMQKQLSTDSARAALASKLVQLKAAPSGLRAGGPLSRRHGILPECVSSHAPKLPPPLDLPSNPRSSGSSFHFPPPPISPPGDERESA